MWGLDGNNIFRALNNKYVKQMQCGDKFVISLGRTVVKKKKRTKEIPQMQQEFPSVTQLPQVEQMPYMNYPEVNLVPRQN